MKYNEIRDFGNGVFFPLYPFLLAGGGWSGHHILSYITLDPFNQAGHLKLFRPPWIAFTIG